jgi:hypothetical protein
LAPSDFHFFPHLKRDFKGTHFTSDDEVKQAVTSWIKQRTPEFFIDGMRKLVLGWETLLPTFVCLNTWSLFLDISLCALLISRPL